MLLCSHPTAPSPGRLAQNLKALFPGDSGSSQLCVESDLAETGWRHTLLFLSWAWAVKTILLKSGQSVLGTPHSTDGTKNNQLKHFFFLFSLEKAGVAARGSHADCGTSLQQEVSCPGLIHGPVGRLLPLSQEAAGKESAKQPALCARPVFRVRPPERRHLKGLVLTVP